MFFPWYKEAKNKLPQYMVIETQTYANRLNQTKKQFQLDISFVTGALNYFETNIDWVPGSYKFSDE